MAEPQDTPSAAPAVDEQQQKLNDFYKKHFGYDFGALTPQQKEIADIALAQVRKASIPLQMTYNGAVAPNKERQQIMENGGLKPDDAVWLGAYSHYKMGLIPSPLDRERLLKAKVPQDQIDRLENESIQNFVKSSTGQFAHLVIPDEKAKPSKDNIIKTTDFEPDEMVVPKPMDEPQEYKKLDNVNVPMPKPSEKDAFQKWLKQNKINDAFNPAQHYDYVSAFRSGAARGPEGHFTDQFKLPGHPTFSNESQYATGDNARFAGSWDQNDNFIPPQAPMETVPSYTPDQPLPQPNQNIWKNYILVPRLKKPGGI